MNTLTQSISTQTVQPELELQKACLLLMEHVNRHAAAEYLGARESFRIESLTGLVLNGYLAIEFGATKLETEVSLPLHHFGALDTAIDSYPDKGVYWLRISRDKDAPISYFNVDQGRRTHSKTLDIPFADLRHAKTAAGLFMEAISYAIL